MEEKELLYFIKNKLARYTLICALAAIMVMMYLGVSQAAGDVALAKPSADILIKAMKNAKKVEGAIKKTKIASPDMDALNKAESLRDEAKEKSEEQSKSQKVGEIVKTQEKLRRSESFKKAQILAKKVLKKNEPKANYENATGEIITERGVDLYEISNRYINEFNKSKNKSSERLKGLYILISSSLPEATIKEIAESSRVVGGTLLLRGMVEGSMPATAEFVAGLHSKGVRAAIHPKIFEMMKVEIVPCYLLIQEGEKGYVHDKICGNISLEYALGEFAARGDVKDAASKLLNRLWGIQ